MSKRGIFCYYHICNGTGALTIVMVSNITLPETTVQTTKGNDRNLGSLVSRLSSSWAMSSFHKPIPASRPVPHFPQGSLPPVSLPHAPFCPLVDFKRNLAGQIAQQVSVLVVRPNDLGLLLSRAMQRWEGIDSQAVLWPPQKHWHTTGMLLWIKTKSQTKVKLLLEEGEMGLQ